MSQSIHSIPIDKLHTTPILKLDAVEKAAQLDFLRRERFVEGFNCNKQVLKLFNEYFGNTNVNQKYGLVVQFKKLKEKILNSKLIGLVLYAVNMDINHKDFLIDDYPNIHGQVIKLTCASISRTLLREYFTLTEIHILCREVNNFDIYYKEES